MRRSIRGTSGDSLTDRQFVNLIREVQQQQQQRTRYTNNKYQLTLMDCATPSRAITHRVVHKS